MPVVCPAGGAVGGCRKKRWPQALLGSVDDVGLQRRWDAAGAARDVAQQYVGAGSCH